MRGWRVGAALLVASCLVASRGSASPDRERAPEHAVRDGMTLYDRSGPSPWDLMFDEVPTPSFLRVAPPARHHQRRAPTPEARRALEELELEASRFRAAGAAYERSVGAMLGRELDRRRRGRARQLDEALANEEQGMVAAREDTVARLERFLSRYPDDPEYTPDGMFRLGELYFEESAQAFATAYADAERRAGDEEVPLEPDFSRTVELYRAVAERFPDYRHIDGVYYLVGYGLLEMGRADEAKRAFLALVCHNHFAYRAPYEGDGLFEALPTAERAEDDARSAPTGYDPYGGCQPVVADSRFASEAWFRVGELHFDRPREPYAFDFAISAYGHILRDSADPNYDLALYKVAWTYYRAGIYDEAVRRFAGILDFADRRRAASGRSGSDLRPEALRQLGQALANDDWNQNGVPDHREGLPSGVDRATDQELIQQDRPYAFDVLAKLGLVYYEESRFELAVAAWRAAVARFPTHRDAPRTIDWIATAHRESEDSEAEIETLAELTNYVEGSPWWRANEDEPGAQQRARALAETALMRTAFHYHEAAQAMRRRCVEEESEELCEEAKPLYARAADSYRGYIRSYPNDPGAYDLHYNLAEALYWSERYGEAATEYAAVRDSNRDDRYRSEAARRVVESLERVADRAIDDGSLEPREDAPEVDERSPPRVRPVGMPALLANLAQAREHYVRRIADRDDGEGVRPAFAYNNALLLYRYGYWPQARARLVRILAERCVGEHADSSGEAAWQTLRSMAIALGDLDEIRRLGLFLEQRECTFQAESGGQVPTEDECQDEERRNHPQCLRRADLNALVYRDALAVFDRAERSDDEAEQRRLYERSAEMLVAAVDRTPTDPQAPIALEQAAIALERTGRFESAGSLYRRIVDEVGPRRGGDADEQARLDAIVANAYFRLGYNENRFFDFASAVESYRVLADSPRFAASSDPRVAEKRNDALVNSALILERLQRYDDAIAYFRRVHSSAEDPEIKQNALYRIAEIHARRGRDEEARRAFREFIDRYRSERAAGDLVVQAYARLAELLAKSLRTPPRENSSYRAALQEVINAYRRSGQPAGSLAAEHAARARFEIEDDIAAFEAWSIDVGRPSTIAQYSERLSRSIRDGSSWAQQLHRRYEPVLEYRRPTWTIAAYVRQGRVFEILANAVLNAPFVVPEDIRRQLARLDAESREDLRLEVEDQVRQLLDEQARPLECVAVGRYALAVRAAGAGSLDDELTRFAIDRLQTYGEERIAACIEQVRERDRTMEPYRPGEFARAARGRHPELEAVHEPPPLMEAPQ